MKVPFSGFHLNGWELVELSRFYFNGVALGVYPQTEKKLVITVKLSLVFGREGFKGHLVGIHISLTNPH